MRYVLSLFLLLFVFSCGQKDVKTADENQPESISEKAAKINMDLHQHDPSIAMHAEQLYACSMNAEYITSDPDTRCVKCQMTLKPVDEVQTDKNTAEVQMYTCSMHPEFVSSEATDRCPICEMKLQAIN